MTGIRARRPSSADWQATARGASIWWAPDSGWWCRRGVSRERGQLNRLIGYQRDGPSRGRSCLTSTHGAVSLSSWNAPVERVADRRGRADGGADGMTGTVDDPGSLFLLHSFLLRCVLVSRVHSVLAVAVLPAFAGEPARCVSSLPLFALDRTLSICRIVF
jgi:hypothetical protein